MIQWVSAFGLSNNKMAMVSGSLGWAYGSSRSVWSKGRRPGAVLHSSREPGCTIAMLLQHDDSTINIVLVLLLLYYYVRSCSNLACQWSDSRRHFACRLTDWFECLRCVAVVFSRDSRFWRKSTLWMTNISKPTCKPIVKELAKCSTVSLKRKK